MAALRASRWVYPIVNAGHIAGLGLLFGAIAALDLRLLGLWRRVPVGVLADVLVPVAITGLVVALITGSMLFSVNAVEYAAMPMFRLKLSLIMFAIINALLLRGVPTWRRHLGCGSTGTTGRLRLAGIVSISLWLSVVLAGRMLGYLR